MSTGGWAPEPQDFLRMTKLNRNRPLLRYLDNVRREMAIHARRTDTLLFGDSTSIAPRPKSDIFPLTKAESDAISRFFEAIENLLDVEAVLVNALGRNATRQAKRAAREVNREAAEERLKGMATAFAAQMVLSGVDGRLNLLNLYKTMQTEYAEVAPFLWETINDIAMKEAMQKISALVGVRH